MAIGSGWVGSSAVNETGQRWMSAAGRAVQVSPPFWIKTLVGKSREQVINVSANNNYSWSTLVSQIKSLGVKDNAFRVNITGTIVSSSTGAPCLNFTSELAGCAYILLVINSGQMVLGRGGNGGGGGNGDANIGKPGGPAITNAIGTKLRIQNNGIIGGGGGGGGAVGAGNNKPTFSGGGGGRPFGIGGSKTYPSGGGGNGSNASLTAPGAGNTSTSLGTSVGGKGGDLGSAGAAASHSGGGKNITPYAGGAGGAAVNGNAPTWVTVGTIYGTRV
ncbi:receptor-recognizing protein [Enterobacter cancerogenus]|uniref:receptor-recognizing protein n=1 Tax=Enterobacter cancerogenus TaxID=69218 RepID=UPI00286566F3|nr:receptor-recognizing protein [Enterobacter cancerogenus]MDT7012648.1 receptor-recognizing protein [Enterobacter cancerogenus]WNN59093.1 receptor-recognizing protein [Enterobacter cancerogenus]HDW3274224.1 receptor-recognizing protein [Enterobacter asburiae]